MKAVSTACLACHLLGGTPLHEPVWVPPPSSPPAGAASWLLPADGAAVGEVRGACRSVLASWRLDDLTESACLVLTELVTNAIRHGEPPIHVLVTNQDGDLGIEVYDSGDGLPRPRSAGFDPGSESGRGLSLVVGTLARFWTVTKVTPAGKTVSAFLARQQPDAGPDPTLRGQQGGGFLPTRSVLGLLPQEWLAPDPSAGTDATGCGHGCGAVSDPSSPPEPPHESFRLLPARPSGRQS